MPVSELQVICATRNRCRRKRGGAVGVDPPARAPSPPTLASADLGELFEYRFSTPVTVKKDESAMLPFLQHKIGSRKLLIYSERATANIP